MTCLRCVLLFTLFTYLFFVVIINIVIADDCGIRKRVNLGRIVGGRPASRNEFPWTVALQKLDEDEYTHFCGAAVINDRWIITAAHCLYNRNISRVRAVFGATDLTIESEFGFTSKLEKSIVHRAFKRETFENDIALIKTKDKIPIDTNKKNVNNICLPENDEEFFGRAYVSGWGRIDEDDIESDLLKVLKINLYDDTDCSEFYNETFYPNLILCAGFVKGRRDACQGDSGGPLERIVFDRSILIGIVSFGRGCGRESSPGVYPEVSHYVNWIRRRMEEEGDSQDVSVTSVKPKPVIIPDTTTTPTTIIAENKHDFRVVNRCPHKVWVSLLTTWGTPTPANGGFLLTPNEAKNVAIDKGWKGRFWGRTGCDTGVWGRNGKICETGDCGHGGEGCQGHSGWPPATIIQVKLDVDSRDEYETNILDGFNLPMSIRPVSGFRYTSNNESDCKPAGCYNNKINENCPQELAVFGKNGKIVGCKSACFSHFRGKDYDKFCCRNEYSSDSTCKQTYASTNYLSNFIDNCPRAKIFFSDSALTYSCTSNPLINYEIVFCPAS